MKKIIMTLILTVISISILTSCNTLLSGLTDSLYRQKDIQLVEDGAPSYLILIEGLLYSRPTNKTLLRTAIQLFNAYSGAFIEDKDRKVIFADKTKKWSMDLLRTYPSFRKIENGSFEDFEKWVKTIKKSDIDYVFWAGYAWIQWVIENADDMDAMTELPKAKAIIDRVYALDSSYYYGTPHLIYGMYYSILPKSAGGDLEKSKDEFDKALEYGGEKFLNTKVFFANFYCKAKYDRDLFVGTLTEVIEADLDKYPEVRLLNTFAQNQAIKLLEQVDEFFYDDDFDF